MPFTGSHPAAILPLLRTPLPPSALVIGSMAPDFVYYAPVHVDLMTHTPLSTFTINLPLGLAVWALWHGVLAAPALAAAPESFRERLSEAQPGLRRRLRELPLVALALVVGVITHLFWDDFTHKGRYAVNRISVLHHQAGPLPGYQWAQYASGVFGAVVLLVWTRRWWRRTPPVPVGPREAHPLVWLALVVVAVAVGTVSAGLESDFRSAGFIGATRGGGAAALLAVTYAIAWHVRRRS